MADRHVLVHTGQNFTPTLNDIFFEELELRKPDHAVSIGDYSVGGQLGSIFREAGRILAEEKPDVVLLLGDTNSALCAVLAERMGIPVVHMEAGNRCYDLRVPEEKNRRVIDAVSTINMPYTPYSKSNLLREGFPAERIVLSGNPIHEVISHYSDRIAASTVLDRLGLQPSGYIVVTSHRAENVDDPMRLASIMEGLNRTAERLGKRLICSIHPRTRARLEQGGMAVPKHELVEFHEPFGFFDFVRLEQDAFCAITDSGTVQEECCLFGVPTVTIRDTTERPETVDCGSNAVCGVDPASIEGAVRVMTALPARWELPEGYGAEDVSDVVVKFLLGGKWRVH